MSNIPEGTRFGRWTVVGSGYRRGKNKVYPCVCDCGERRDVLKFTLVEGRSKSCGCYKDQRASETWFQHGLSKTAEYRTWVGMLHRHEQPVYAERGITVCSRWRESFENFLADMGPRPDDKHSLDRINNDGNYEPGNCHWATWTQQARNKRNSRHITYNGQTKTVAEWSELTGIRHGTLLNRLNKGWSAEKTITQPVKPQGVRRIS